jgi:hypothetical protein
MDKCEDNVKNKKCNLCEQDNLIAEIQVQTCDKCNFCDQVGLGVKFQTLDRKKYVPICNKCFLEILFPNNTIKNTKDNIIKNKN